MSTRGVRLRQESAYRIGARLVQESDRRQDSMITQDRLKELFDYNQETGIFTRRTKAGRNRSGEVAGSLSRNGYLTITSNITLTDWLGSTSTEKCQSVKLTMLMVIGHETVSQICALQRLHKTTRTFGQQKRETSLDSLAFAGTKER